MEQEKLGRIIAEARKERGLTQDDVAKRLGITSQSVSKWERGVNAPDVSLLLDLCEILGIEVDELLSGERKLSINGSVKESFEKNIEVEKSDKKSSVNKKFFIKLALCLIVILLIFVVSFFIHIVFTNTEKFEYIAKDDMLVKEAMDYIDFKQDINKNLLQHLFDNNDSVLTKNDLGNDEKMFLVLNKYKKDHELGTNWYARIDYLEKVFFEDTRFLEEYSKNQVHFTIQNTIDYSCYNGILSYEERNVDKGIKRDLFFDILDAKKSNTTLVIDFRMVYVENYEYSHFIAFYKNDNMGDHVSQIRKNEVDFDTLKLSEEFHTFRYKLKIEDGKMYFESLKRLEN